MRLAALLLLASCATVQPSGIVDPDIICRPDPSIAGVEGDCTSADEDVRTCDYRVGNCRIVLYRRGCEGEWSELHRQCSLGLLRAPGERDS